MDAVREARTLLEGIQAVNESFEMAGVRNT